MTETRRKPVSRIGKNAGKKLIAWNAMAQVWNMTLTYVTWEIKTLRQFYFVLIKVNGGGDLRFSGS